MKLREKQKKIKHNKLMNKFEQEIILRNQRAISRFKSIVSNKNTIK